MLWHDTVALQRLDILEHVALVDQALLIGRNFGLFLRPDRRFRLTPIDQASKQTDITSIIVLKSAMVMSLAFSTSTVNFLPSGAILTWIVFFDICASTTPISKRPGAEEAADTRHRRQGDRKGMSASACRRWIRTHNTITYRRTARTATGDVGNRVFEVLEFFSPTRPTFGACVTLRVLSALQWFASPTRNRIVLSGT